ncbi:MAG: nucleotidyltransferase family protein [Chloroflexi bacterium]|nr:nucleotidyltransferase family protein [Chloroflexota bacterium]
MSYKKIAGIVLAAGESKRFGRPKQLLNWSGITFVQKVIRTAYEASLDPVYIVLGSSAPKINNIIKNEGAIVIRNHEWSKGQSSSIRNVIKSINNDIDAIVILLCDQPQVTPELLKDLVGLYKYSGTKIVSTRINGNSCPPILFDRVCFSELSLLQGDTGAKSLIGTYPTEFLDWKDQRVIRDVDTEEDYKDLLSSYE